MRTLEALALEIAHHRPESARIFSRLERQVPTPVPAAGEGVHSASKVIEKRAAA
jgi:hypothetical protein